MAIQSSNDLDLGGMPTSMSVFPRFLRVFDLCPLKNQIYLGDDEFVEEMQCKIDPDQPLNDIPRKQKIAPPKPIAYFAQKYVDRSEAMARAYLSRHYTLEEVGNAFGVSYATVSRAVRDHEQKRQM